MPFSFTHGMTDTKEYYAYRNMLNRCYYKLAKSYKDYGAKGIIVCERWLKSFENFIKDMGKCPSNKHSLDRIDNTKGYSPDNCRWATHSEQAWNRGLNKGVKVKYKGVVYEKKKKLYRARIMKNGKSISLGRRKSAKDCALLYDKKAIELFGDFAVTNEKLGLLEV